MVSNCAKSFIEFDHTYRNLPKKKASYCMSSKHYLYLSCLELYLCLEQYWGGLDKIEGGGTMGQWLRKQGNLVKMFWQAQCPLCASSRPTSQIETKSCRKCDPSKGSDCVFFKCFYRSRWTYGGKADQPASKHCLKLGRSPAGNTARPFESFESSDCVFYSF